MGWHAALSAAPHVGPPGVQMSAHCKHKEGKDNTID